jgi:cytochrome P450
MVRRFAFTPVQQFLRRWGGRREAGRLDGGIRQTVWRFASRAPDLGTGGFMKSSAVGTGVEDGLIDAPGAPTAPLPLPGRRGLRDIIRGLAAYWRDPFQFFVDLRSEAGDITRLWNPRFPLVVVYHPEMVEHILVRNARNYTKDFYLRQWKEVFGEGLLTAEGEHWKKERRLLQPTFNKDRIEAYSARMRVLARETFGRWHSGETRDVSGEMMGLTLRIVVDTLFGRQVDSGVVDRVARAFAVCSRYFTFTGGVIGSYFRRLPLPIRLRYVRAVKEFDAIIGGIIEQRGREGGSRDDMLGMLLDLRDEDGSQMSNQQLRDEIMTMFLAGHETTALTLAYSLWLFAGDRAAQERAALDAGYLKQFILESMRLYPPAWALLREATADDVVGGHQIPARSNVVIPTWAIHRDPRFYPEPLEFRPERWTPEFQKSLPRAAYLPFGFGARMCIGYTFAMSEAQILLAEALRQCRFTRADETRLKFDASITMRPRGPVRLRVARENRSDERRPGAAARRIDDAVEQV